MLRFSEPDGLSWSRARGVPSMEYAYPYFRRRLERHRFDWVAAGLQRFTEEHLATWVRNAIVATGVRKVALGGGVFMNVPFAPAILAEHSVEYLENPRGMPAPYMIITFPTKRADDFPAAIQPYDRTARPQVVYREHSRIFTASSDTSGTGQAGLSLLGARSRRSERAFPPRIRRMLDR